MMAQYYVRWFGDLRLADVPTVGGKNASLGELHAALAGGAITVPEGFALTAEAYRDALALFDAADPLRRLLTGFDHRDVTALAERAAAARQIVYEATGNLRVHKPTYREGYRAVLRHIGICGEAPADYPEIARYLAGLGIDSISVNPASLLATLDAVAAAE
jgi:pyruvate,water dikinase